MCSPWKIDHEIRGFPSDDDLSRIPSPSSKVMSVTRTTESPWLDAWRKPIKMPHLGMVDPCPFMNRWNSSTMTPASPLPQTKRLWSNAESLRCCHLHSNGVGAVAYGDAVCFNGCWTCHKTTRGHQKIGEMIFSTLLNQQMELITLFAEKPTRGLWDPF